MPLFGPPDIEKMKAHRDIKGLIQVFSDRKNCVTRDFAARGIGQAGGS